MTIIPTMNLGELAEKYPKAAEYLQKEWGLHCIGCPANVMDSLKDGMKLHGYSDEEIIEAVTAVNALTE